MINILRVGGEVLSLIRGYPVVLSPFLLIGFFDLLLLTVLYAFPVTLPFAGMLGDQAAAGTLSPVLSLPFTFSCARQALSFVTGLVLTGTAIAMIQQAFHQTHPTWAFGARKTLRRYVRSAILWTLSFMVGLLTPDVLRYAGTLFAQKDISSAFGFIVVIIAQMLLVFAFPAVILENKKFWSAIKRSAVLFRQRFREALLILAVPNAVMLLLLPRVLFVPSISDTNYSGIILVNLGLRIVVLMILNFWVVASVTVLMIMHRESERSAMIPA
jgi:hypothetical protein